LIQVYTGNGKGKTTAAIGLAVRAAGAGFNVYIAHFCKGRRCSELNILKKIKNIRVRQFGGNRFIMKPDERSVRSARQGLRCVKEIICGGNFDVIILDEINVAVKLGLLCVDDILGLIKEAPRSLELILTGRDAHPEVLKAADLASEIKDIKHYFSKGKKARKGIEF